MSPETQESIQIILELMYEDLYQADMQGKIDPDVLNVLAESIVDIRELLIIEGK